MDHNCDECRTSLTPFLEGAMSKEKTKEFGSHLEGCGTCRDFLNEARRCREIIRRAAPTSLPRGLTIPAPNAPRGRGIQPILTVSLTAASALFMIALLLFSQGVPRRLPAGVSQDIAALLEQLSDDSVQIREEAQKRLIDAAIADPTLEAILLKHLAEASDPELRGRLDALLKTLAGDRFRRRGLKLVHRANLPFSSAACFLPDGKHVIQVKDCDLHIFDVAAGKVTRVLPLDMSTSAPGLLDVGGPLDVKVSPDGRRLAVLTQTGGQESNVHVFRIDLEFKREWRFQLYEEGDARPEGAEKLHFVSASRLRAHGLFRFHRIWEYDLEGGTLVKHLRLDEKEGFGHVAVSLDGRFVAFANAYDQPLRVVDLSSGQTVHAISRAGLMEIPLVFLGASTILTYDSDSRTLLVRDLASAIATRSIELPEREVDEGLGSGIPCWSLGLIHQALDLLILERHGIRHIVHLGSQTLVHTERTSPGVRPWTYDPFGEAYLSVGSVFTLQPSR